MVSLDSRSRAWSVAASVAVLIALFSGQAVAADFRIRLHRQQGKQVHIYHDRVQGGLEGTVEINIGATQCKPDTGEVLKPGRMICVPGFYWWLTSASIVCEARALHLLARAS